MKKICDSASVTTGLLMLLTGLILVSPIGFVLLLVLFYAMWVQNLVLGVVCGSLLSIPMLLGTFWAPTAWAIVIRERCIPGLIKEPCC